MSEAPVSGLVSVVVASYNHARYLPRRMESLIDQTYGSMEILVIDDCSPDNSVEVLQAYGGRSGVRLVLRERNGGWVAVSNQGAGMSRGEYILFANCDDDCEPSMVEGLVRALEAHPTAGLAFCRSLMVDENGDVLGDDFRIREPSFRRRCGEDCFIPRDEMRRFLMHSCVIPNLSAALMRRCCFERVGGLSPDFRVCSDWDLFFRLAEEADFAYVARPLNHFRQHGRTIRSANKGRVTYDEYFRLLLGQIRRGGFTAAERARYRFHVMYLWAVDLLRPAAAGFCNLPHHTRLVASLDALSLAFLLPALLWRLLELPQKMWRRLGGDGP